MRKSIAAAATNYHCLKLTAFSARSLFAGTGATPSCTGFRRWPVHKSCFILRAVPIPLKRLRGNAPPAAPNTKIFHCVANTIGQSPDGKQTSSGGSFIREPAGLPLAEAGYYREKMITAVLDIDRADRSYILDSMEHPPFLKKYWHEMIEDMKSRADILVKG